MLGHGRDSLLRALTLFAVFWAWRFGSKMRIYNHNKINKLYVIDFICYFISIWFYWCFCGGPIRPQVRPDWVNSGEGLALVAEEVLAGSWCVVNFILASEQGSQIFVDVVHISPRGFLWPSSLSILAILWSGSSDIFVKAYDFIMIAFSWRL